MNIKLLDCTLRDGGYYNAWDFDPKTVQAYLNAMHALPADLVEIGLRIPRREEQGFKGAFAYSRESFLQSLDLKKYSFETAVMLNATDVLGPQGLDKGLLSELFGPQKDSNIQWVRLAVHVDKLKQSIEVVSWLHEQGYQTTVNLMQIGGVGLEEIHEIAEICSRYPQDVLYFADSLGSMTPEDIDLVVTGLRKHWAGALGFHGHNNMERAVQNALRAMALGVEYIDATVLGMGRGPGNLQTEYLAIELENQPNKNINSTPLMSLITKHFQPLKDQYHWGPNPYYYMAGKYGIHPTYVQEMIGNTSYDDEDILAVIHHLRVDGAKRYNYKTMESAKNFFHGQPRGNWNPRAVMESKEVLILGSGPGIAKYKDPLEQYIRQNSPFVLGLNTHEVVNSELIDSRIACHPVRLLADCEHHAAQSQPLITPLSMLPREIREPLEKKNYWDFGLSVLPGKFGLQEDYVEIPKLMVIAYALAVVSRARASKILLAGFDGYPSGDPRNQEMNEVLETYQVMDHALPLFAITPSKYKIHQNSIFSMI